MKLDDFQNLLDRRQAVLALLRGEPRSGRAATQKLQEELEHIQAQIDAALRDAAKEES